jgi:hypothetical protein
MGIVGLLPNLKSVTREAHIRECDGQRVAVDGYVWLHRGLYTCAQDLCLGVPTDKCAVPRVALNSAKTALLTSAPLPLLLRAAGTSRTS